MDGTEVHGVGLGFLKYLEVQGDKKESARKQREQPGRQATRPVRGSGNQVERGPRVGESDQMCLQTPKRSGR